MSDYKTPGVYVEEISTFPTSVVRVATAVPAFVGYTERATLEGNDLTNVPTKVRSLVEFESIFGGEPTSSGRTITVHLDANNKPSTVDLGLTYYLYQSLRHYYANGGGDAYIVSIGGYGTALAAGDLKDGVDTLAYRDEPTLILAPDAFGLSTTGLGEVQAHILAHCNKLQDRFGIFDVKSTGVENTDAAAFRLKIGNQNLKYGAAYYPPLKTTITPNGAIEMSSFTLKDAAGATKTLDALANDVGDSNLIGYGDILADQAKLASSQSNLYGSPARTWAQLISDVGVRFDADLPNNTNDVDSVTWVSDSIKLLGKMASIIYGFKVPATFENDAIEALKVLIVNGQVSPLIEPTLKAPVTTLFNLHQFFPLTTMTTPGGTPSPLAIMLPANFASPDYGLQLVPTGDNPYTGSVSMTAASIIVAVNTARPTFKVVFESLKALYNSLTALATAQITALGDLQKTSSVFSGIISAIRGTGYTLPPSGAVAGVYAAVDAARGVWKAPANVSLSAVASVAKMSESDLDDLNVSETGKSINAIRFFRGQGNLVYGARTLAGNDNEWRFVPVRRLFIMAEESIRKATEPLVFEPNDANTWLKAKAMIENFLSVLWRDGALAGAVPKDAYFVKVGLGQTMTAQDILEGKLIIEIGMAAVRPAEFIILKFFHKLQES
jgi:uncharacterized protein